MKLWITIDIFSGRENPIIELEGKDAADALHRLKPGPSLKKNEMGPPLSTLGYRGLLIEQLGARSRNLPKQFRLVNGKLFGADLAHRAADEEFEDFITRSRGPIRKVKMGKGFDQFLAGEISRYRQLDAEYAAKKILWPPKPIKLCLCAPVYEPQWWNDGGQKQLHNNCYNYSTNYRTDTFRVISGGGQPGAAAGAMYTSLTCASVLPAAEKDGLINKPDADNKCPSVGHLVALVIAPGWDFHWYRKGPNNYWSHKPGSTAVTNLDNSGNLISDPRTANRGPYTDFCTFMVVMHGHIKIK